MTYFLEAYTGLAYRHPQFCNKKRLLYYSPFYSQNSPFQKGLKEGSVVTAGDVIGYMGHTGYSKKGGQQDHNPQSHSTSYNTYCTT